MKQTIADLALTLGKITGITERLGRVIEGSYLNRNQCKDILFELKSSFMILKQYFMDLICLCQQQGSYAGQANILPAFLIFLETFQNQKAEGFLDGFINDSNSLATYVLDNAQSYKDQEIKNRVYELISRTNFLIETLDSKILRQFSAEITGISKITELVGEKVAGLDESWAAATCYLCAMDIAINKKRKELGLIENEKSDKGRPFDEKFDELLGVLDIREAEINRVVKQLPKDFWRIRTDVVHHGYLPTQEELDLICNWSKRIINTIHVR